MYWERPRHRANRSAFNSRLSQNVQYRGATDANLARHVSGRSSRLVQLHHALADTPGRTTVLDDGPANGSSGRWTKFNGGIGGYCARATIVDLHETLPNLICLLPSGRFSWRVFVLPWLWVLWLRLPWLPCLFRLSSLL